MTAERFSLLREGLGGGLRVTTGRRISTDSYGNRFSEITIMRGRDVVARGRIYKDRDRVEFSTADPRLIGRLQEINIPSVDELLEHWQKTESMGYGLPARTRRGTMPGIRPTPLTRAEGLSGTERARSMRSVVPGRGTAFELTPEQYRQLQDSLGQDYRLRTEGEYPRMNFRHETLRSGGSGDRVAARAYVHYSRFGGRPTRVSLRTTEPRILQELERMGIRPMGMQEGWSIPSRMQVQW